MKAVEKKSLSKSQRLAIILSSVLVLLIAGSIVLSMIVANRGKDTPQTELPDIRSELGESLYSGMPIAYERIEEAEILSMVVSREEIVRDEDGNDVKKTHKFDLTRWPDNNASFWLGYDDGSGSTTPILYSPPIVDAEGNFDYESLYALEGNDGYGTMTMLSYLCSAVGTVYFTERIDLPESEAERLVLLEEYGLAGDESEVTTVSFVYEYKGDDGKFSGEGGTHHLRIGAPALNGDGFYYRVDGRNCVYYTRYSTFKYAKLGFESFVKGSLIAAGLSSDKSFEPLLTTEFTEWKNEIHDKESDIVESGSSVISVGNVKTPVKESAKYKPEDYPDGYLTVSGTEFDFDLSKLSEHPEFDRIRDALVGASVGEQSGLYLTLLSELYGTSDMVIDFGNNAALTYRYEIREIESIVDMPRAGGVYECAVPGTEVGSSAKLLRVSYDYYIGGTKQNTVSRHAVLDITDSLVPDDAEAALRASRVGELASAVTFDVTYTKDNAYKSAEALIISDIIVIYTPAGAMASEVGENSYVSLKYYESINGKNGDKQSKFISMSDIKNDTKLSGMYTALLGKKTGKNLELTAYSSTYYHEIMRGFTTYEITEIEGYVTSEEIVSFRFWNESIRDPFYGESVYELLTDKYKLYGVDADVCQNVLRILGGLDSSTSSSSGLAGTTVAVGLTHENMKKYNLYDYTIYFELPRIISTETIKPEDGGESIEDYNWDHELGFTLYISRPDPATGLRYVGSDMYDVVATVSAETFEFLDYSFVDFWARRSMIMLELGNVDTFKLDFFMEDVKGSYDFEIRKETVYVHPTYGQPSYSYFEGSVEQDYFTVFVTESGDVMTDTELHKFALEAGSDRVALHKLYNKVMGGGEDLLLPNSIEWVGVSNFMLAFQVMQMTPYEGSVTDAERAKASEDNKLMRITIGLDARNASENCYVYEFYRVADRKVMVKTYKVNDAGDRIDGTEVSDMYISTFAFKKLVNAYLSVFNAKEVDGEVPYTDMVGN